MLFLKLIDKFIDVCLQIKGRFFPGPFGRELVSFWIRRKAIFKNFDFGIQTDAEGLYSAVPEKIAAEITSKIKSVTVVDGFSGIGAMAIVMAKLGKEVIAVELNFKRLEMAKHNAGICGVSERINFYNGNFLELAGSLKGDTVFLDPPWGGLSYENLKLFKLSNFSPNGVQILKTSFENFKHVILRVPRQFDFSELAGLGREYKVQNNYIRSKLYSKTIYFK